MAHRSGMRLTPGPNRRARTTAALATICAMIASVSGASVAQAQGSDGRTAEPTFRTERVAPGIERILGDDAGHDLTERYPKHHRDMDHIAIAPDGTVWIAGTASRSDNEFLSGFLVWPMGRPGLYGIEDGVPEHIDRFFAMPNGDIWAIGSSVAVFDGESWSGQERPYTAATPDGTLWLVSGREGLVSWDGEAFSRHRPGSHVESILTDPDGTLWAIGDGVWSYDGDSWSQQLSSRRMRHLLVGPMGNVWAAGRGVASWDGERWSRHLDGEDIQGLRRDADGSIVAVARRHIHTYDGDAWSRTRLPGERRRSPDGARWKTRGNTVERILDGRRRSFSTGGQINQIAVAPDGSVWVIGSVSRNENGGVFRIRVGDGAP